MSNLNNMSKPADSRLEYLFSNWLFGKSADNDIRLTENYILCYEEVAMYVDRNDLLLLTHMNNLVPISLTKPQVKMILAIIDYYNFMYWNRDKALAEYPTQWDTEVFKAWKRNGRPTSEHYIQLKKCQQRYILARLDKTTSIVATTTTTATVICMGEVNSNLNVANADSVKNCNANIQSSTEAPTKIVLVKEVISNESGTESVSNEEATWDLKVIDVVDAEAFSTDIVSTEGEIDDAKFQRSTVSVPVTIPITILSTTTATVIHTEMLDMHAKIASNNIVWNLHRTYRVVTLLCQTMGRF